MTDTPGLKARLRSDLTAAMKARDTTTTGTLRMVLAALTTEEVAGSEARELSDADVVRVLQREVKKRAESAEVYAGAGREELAERERAEIAVIERYLPQQLSDDELAELARRAVAEVSGDGPAGMALMGAAMKVATAAAAGRADGKRVSAAVRAALS